ncbi:oligosaccharide flippase family protein [Seonamhaeicola sp. MEBiC1930]|uniref:oligosaccharide flippase family protein n=1 Tax=Seonamhaeicola sp. MEBiC01930 TaxID=2976768 RepID=UPI0032501381
MNKIKQEKRIIASNFFSLSVLQIANYILPLIILPFLVRVLGLEKFGLVMFAQSLATFFNIAVDFGFEISGTREIALLKKQKEKVSQIFSAIILIKLGLVIFWFLMLWFMVELVPRFRENSIVYFLSFGVVVGNTLFPVWFFQGIEKMKFVTLINILAKLIFTILIFFIIRNESDYYLVPAFNSIGYIIAGFLGLVIALKHTKLVVPPWILIKRLFYDSTSLFLGKFATNLYTTCNVLILGFFTVDSIVGVYSSIEKLLLAVKNVYVPFYQAVFPWLSNQPYIKRIQFLKKIGPVILMVGVGITSVILFFGKEILTIIYNDEFLLEYINVFKILGFLAILSGLNMMFISLYFPAVKMYKTRMRILFQAGILHLCISLVLVKINGIYGMAFSVLTTELLLLVFSYIIYIKNLKKEKECFLSKENIQD